MKFSEMKYERPDKAQLIEKMKSLIAQFKDAKTAEEAKKVLDEAGVEPLDDELLDAVAAGLYPWPKSESEDWPDLFRKFR